MPRELRRAARKLQQTESVTFLALIRFKALRNGGMANEVRLSQADIKKASVTVPVTMRGLSRLVIWGIFAVTAMLIALLASRGVVGSQRASVAVSTINQGVNSAPAPEAVRPANDSHAAADIRRLGDVVADLAASDKQIKQRLDAVEQNMTDVTGSIAKQNAEARNAAAPAPWPDGPSIPSTPAAIAEVVAPALPQPMEYGVDIGSAVSIQALRARWAGIHSAHHDLLRGLVPTVTLRETQRTNNPELRLVIGPLQSADAATHLCAALSAYRLSCEPTIFGGQHLALE